ncbi:MAG: YggS family pyridoxal phosphate-dependent enzyme [Heliobacteriaceae bacterium]|jgi:pyridoxal phosphate enzyme (YggS family)|nr:YggS family pyridoxal phosphate-dependent enzyme [Heliobacteriaceae bacterium]
MRHVIKRNLEKVKEDIAHYQPNIIAVTKYFDESAITEAYHAGLRDFGESRVIEAAEKINRLEKQVREDSKFHLIGHLQSNKVKKAVSTFDLIQSADSVKLARLISEEAQKIGKVQDILLQLNNSGEEQKFGFSKEELLEALPEIQRLPGVSVKGIMTMAPLGAGEAELERLFAQAVQVKEICNLQEISMGMSQDYKTAARMGSTMLRIGRKLFEQ